MATSKIMTFAATATAGLPAPMSAPAYLSGGARGATLAADILNAVNELGAIECNIIVPLFSQDATADIAAGQTDPDSTYTIAAIDALLKSHCIGKVIQALIEIAFAFFLIMELSHNRKKLRRDLQAIAVLLHSKTLLKLIQLELSHNSSLGMLQL